MLVAEGRPTIQFAKEQRGITGLETAIVLIAFVVVASVFAFAVLSTGLLSSEKSKETIVGALEETSATLVLKGSVVAITRAVPPPQHVSDVRFQLTNASKGGEAVNLSTSGVNAAIVTYIDADQSANLTTWTASWLSGGGPLLEPGETVEISVDITGLATTLVEDKEFTIQVKPTVGATLVLNRKIPSELTSVLDLN